MGFTSLDEVEAWAEQNGGPEGLSEALAQGRFGNDLRTMNLTSQWFARIEAAKQEQVAREERQLRAREVRAAEASAVAAREAADASKAAATAAQKSAHWAVWASVIAVVAILVAVFK